MYKYLYVYIFVIINGISSHPYSLFPLLHQRLHILYKTYKTYPNVIFIGLHYLTYLHNTTTFFLFFSCLFSSTPHYFIRYCHCLLLANITDSRPQKRHEGFSMSNRRLTRTHTSTFSVSFVKNRIQNKTIQNVLI